MSTRDGPDGGQARVVDFDDLDADSADGDVRPRVVSFDEETEEPGTGPPTLVQGADQDGPFGAAEPADAPAGDAETGSVLRGTGSGIRETGPGPRDTGPGLRNPASAEGPPRDGAARDDHDRTGPTGRGGTGTSTGEGGAGEHDATRVRVVSFDSFDDLGAEDRRPAFGRRGQRSARSDPGGSSRSGGPGGRRDAAVDRAPSPAAGTGADAGAGDGAAPDTAIGGVAAAGEGGSTTAGVGAGNRRGGRAGRAPGKDAPTDEESRAREICLRLLTDRARTVKELTDTLRRKGIPDDVARRVLERFDEVGLVDDEAFAGQWVRSRHRHKGLGRRAIAAELHHKGVAKHVADDALTEIDAESEESRARELVDRRLRSMRVDTKEDRANAARRLVGMLARKGYGSGVAYGVVREAIAARGAEEDELGEAPTGD